jgi:protein SCO1/2
MGLVLPGFSVAAACNLGTASTADKTIDVSLRLVSSKCNDPSASDATPLTTGDAVAVKVRLLIHGSDTQAPTAEVKTVTLQRDDGLPSPSAPGARRLAVGTYFSDLEVAAAGTWTLAVTLTRDQMDETVKITLPVALNPAQAARIVAHEANVPHFSLQDAQGKTVTDATLLGKVWVANFFFASCPDACPLMSKKLAGLQQTFKNAKDFHIVSVTTDPATDQPAVLDEFARRYHADQSRWHFLRGAKSTAVALSKGGLELDVKDDTPMHSVKFAVVDRDGVVRGRYDSTKTEELEQLKVAIKELLAKKPAPRRS